MPKTEELGIACPACGKAMRQKKTTNKRGHIRRRRRCPDCGHRITTIEKPYNTAPPAGIDRRMAAEAVIDLAEKLDVLDEVRDDGR